MANKGTYKLSAMSESQIAYFVDFPANRKDSDGFGYLRISNVDI